MGASDGEFKKVIAHRNKKDDIKKSLEEESIYTDPTKKTNIPEEIYQKIEIKKEFILSQLALFRNRKKEYDKERVRKSYELNEIDENNYSSKINELYNKKKIGISERFPYLTNYFTNIFHKIVIAKDKTRYPLNTPWHIMDGLSFFFRTKQRTMPFNWSSTIKIVNNLGEDICLIDHNHRHLAKILVAAPDLYKFLLHIYLNKDKLFKEEVLEDDSNPIISQMQTICAALFATHEFDIDSIDTETYLSCVAMDFFREIIYIIASNDYSEKDIIDFLRGRSSEFEDAFWTSLKRSFYKSIMYAINTKSTKMDLRSFYFNQKILNEIQSDLNELTEDQFEEIIKTYLRTNFKVVAFQEKPEERKENSKPAYTPVFTLHDVYNNIESISSIWNLGQDSVFDNFIYQSINVSKEENEKAFRKTIKESSANISLLIKSENIKKILTSLGIAEHKINKIPVPILEEIVLFYQNLIEDNEEKKAYKAIIAALSKNFYRYHELLVDYKFDIIEMERDIEENISNKFELEEDFKEFLNFVNPQDLTDEEIENIIKSDNKNIQTEEGMLALQNVSQGIEDLSIEDLDES